MIKTGLIGCGSFGKHHLRLLKELDPPFVGLYDADSAHAGQMAEASGVQNFGSIEELLSASDAVIVAVPTIHHFDIGMKALEAGCHILVEKPICETVSQAYSLANEGVKRGKVVAVGHVERHNPVVMHLIDTVTSPRYAVIERLSPFTRRSLDIDVILDLMIHDLQIILEIAGEKPSEIKALGIPVLSQKVDMAAVHLTFPSGFMANVTASRVSDVRVRKVRLFQNHAYCSVDYAEKKFKGYKLSMTSAEPEIVEDKTEIREGEPLKNEIIDFLNACKDGGEALVSGQRAAEALELAKRIQEVVT